VIKIKGLSIIIKNLYIGATKKAVASANLTQRILGAISHTKSTIQDTTSTAIHAHFSGERFIDFAISRATTVPSEDIHIVTTVVHIRLTISNDSFFSFIFFSARAQSLHFLR